MKRAYTNKKTGQIDDGLVRDVVDLVQTQVVDEVSQLQTEDDASTASTNLSRFRINEIVESEYFVGTSEDWTIGNFLGIYRGSPPSVYSEELSDDLVVLGVFSEIQFLGIPSEISEGFPRKNEFPRTFVDGMSSE
uniref:Uncharacterized protein n=1 Tax=Brassica oleracea var. oleracea TaxID=109376 RepID=A0A0D3B7N6_BRAOL